MTTTDTTPLIERIEVSAREVMRRSALIADVDLPAYLAAAVFPIVEAEARKAKAEAWDEGHSWGWSDAQDAHDVRQAMDRADWPLSTPNPYRQEVDR